MLERYMKDDAKIIIQQLRGLMKKSLKVFILFLLATCIITFIAYKFYPQIYYKDLDPISTPDIIYVYSYDKRIVIDKDSPIFDEIVSLTNKRLNTDLSVAQDIVDDRVINELKKDSLNLEFIYNQEQRLNMFSYGRSFSYHKLFFPLVSSKSGTQQNSIIYTMQYGNKEHYIDSSRGFLTNPKGIVKLIQGYKNK